MSTVPNIENMPEQVAPLKQGSKKLYVGNLDAQIDEAKLRKICSIDSPSDVVDSVKIIPQQGGFSYGFVEFKDAKHAESAIRKLNGKRIMGSDIRVNWAYTGPKELQTNQSHIFVGDLGSEITDELLRQAFSSFGELTDARVMWDSMNGKSRGYGFVAFKNRADAEKSIAAMNNEWMGSRIVRVNWANQKSNQSKLDIVSRSASRDSDVRSVMAQSHAFNTTIYIGNISHDTSQIDVAPLFSQFGFVRELRLQNDKGFGFIKLDSHENAAMAILLLNGYNLNGRKIKVSWGKERATDRTAFNSVIMPSFPYPHQPLTWFFPGDQNGGPGMMIPIANGAASYDSIYSAPIHWEQTQQQMGSGYY